MLLSSIWYAMIALTYITHTQNANQKLWHSNLLKGTKKDKTVFSEFFKNCIISGNWNYLDQFTNCALDGTAIIKTLLTRDHTNPLFLRSFFLLTGNKKMLQSLWDPDSTIGSTQSLSVIFLRVENSWWSDFFKSWEQLTMNLRLQHRDFLWLELRKTEKAFNTKLY